MRRKFKHKTPQTPELNKQVFDLLRLIRGHCTADLARGSELSHSCISKLRTRRTRYPRFSTINALAQAVGARVVIVPAEATEFAERPGRRRQSANGEARVH